MLTITTIAVKQLEETKQEENFSETITLGETFEWSGQGAATLGRVCNSSRSARVGSAIAAFDF